MRRESCLKAFEQALWQSRAGAGAWKRARIDCQNGVRRKSRFHHARQRASVRTGTVSDLARCCAVAPPGGETNASTTARYTRRPKNRTDTGVVRWSHRAQQKLKRQE